tara:strand:- start:38 stop:574 length:537 start_codon:yes stop_codon:yes gene_type:complete
MTLRYEKIPYIVIMKKLLYILTAFAIFSFNLLKSTPKEDIMAYRPPVDVNLEKHFNKLDSIYTARGIIIDYTQVSAIKDMTQLPPDPRHNGRQFEGLYNRITKVVYINTFQSEAFWNGTYEEKILVIIAHEVAHSQGIDHTLNPCSIMYPSSAYSLALINTTNIDKLVTDIYFDNTTH